MSVRRVVRLLVVASLLTAAAAKKYTLCDDAVTSGDRENVWSPRAPWTPGSPVKSVKVGLDDVGLKIKFGSPMTINSGGMWSMTNNMAAELAFDGFVIQFADSTPPSGTDVVYNFDPKTDISCHSNICEDKGTSAPGARSTEPLRDGDILVLYEDKSYYVNVDQENPDFTFLTFSKLRYHGQDYDNCEDVVALSPLEFHLQCNDFFFLDDLSMCEAHFWTNEEDECFGHTSCPSDAQRLQQEDDMRQADQKQAEETMALRTKDITTNINLIVTLPSITGPYADALKTYFTGTPADKQVAVDAATQRLETFWNTDSVTADATLTDSGVLVFSLSGTVTAAAAEIFGTSFATEAELNALVAAGLKVDSTKFSAGESSAVIDELRAAIAELIKIQLQADTAKKIDGFADACTLCPQGTTDTILEIADIIADPTQLDNTKLVQCINDPNPLQCVTDVLKETGTTEDVDEVAKRIVDLLDGVKDDPTALEQITKILDDSGDSTKTLNDQKDSVDQVSPAPRTLVMNDVPYFEAGNNVYLLANHKHNLLSFRDVAVTALSVPLPLTSNDPSDTTAFTVAVIEPNVARRAVGSAGPHLESDLSYTKLCYPSQSDEECKYPVGSDMYTQVQETLNLAAKSIKLTGSQCYLLSSGWNMTCLQDIADDTFTAVKDAGGTDTEGHTQAKDAVHEVVKCDPIMGFNPDDSCVKPNDKATKIATDAADQSLKAFGSEAPPQDPDASTSSSASSTPMLAGIAAAAIIIVLLCFVIYKMKSRKNAPKKHNSNVANIDRNVVAFENPLYDDSQDKTVHNPLHTMEDDSGGLYEDIYRDADAFGFDNGAEGIYDSPDFVNQAPKEDIYSDSFGFDDEDDDGGYLDTSPDTGDLGQNYEDVEEDDDGGYLDTAPAPEYDTMQPRTMSFTRRNSSSLKKSAPAAEADYDTMTSFGFQDVRLKQNPLYDEDEENEYEDDEGGYLAVGPDGN